MFHGAVPYNSMRVNTFSKMSTLTFFPRNKFFLLYPHSYPSHYFYIQICHFRHNHKHGMRYLKSFTSSSLLCSIIMFILCSFVFLLIMVSWCSVSRSNWTSKSPTASASNFHSLGGQFVQGYLHSYISSRNQEARMIESRAKPNAIIQNCQLPSTIADGEKDTIQTDVSPTKKISNVLKKYVTRSKTHRPDRQVQSLLQPGAMYFRQRFNIKNVD